MRIVQPSPGLKSRSLICVGLRRPRTSGSPRREYNSEWVDTLQERSDELRPILETNGVAHFVVSSQGATPEDVAQTILELVGWIG